MTDKRRPSLRDGSSMWKGLAAGLVGGLIASWTMNRFQDVWSRLAEGNEKSPHARSPGQGSTPEARAKQASSEEADDTTVKTASAISRVSFSTS